MTGNENPSQPDDALSLDFRQAMRRLTSTVTIVTKAHEEGPLGMTATAVTSLTTSPPAMLICINRRASICQWLGLEQAFCVNLLASSHAGVADQFAGASPVSKRFSHGEWRYDNGVPYLADAVSSLFCTVDLSTDYGTHTILVGKISKVMLSPKVSPLLYGNGRYSTIASEITQEI